MSTSLIGQASNLASKTEDSAGTKDSGDLSSEITSMYTAQDPTEIIMKERLDESPGVSAWMEGALISQIVELTAHGYSSASPPSPERTPTE